MSNTNADIETILNELSKSLDGNQVDGILDNPKEYPTELIEKLSIETALKYWNGKIDYLAGDFIMNNIYSFWLGNQYYYKNHDFSEIAWECYNAFDAGEYFHDGDERNIDPVEKYTRPQIEKLLRKRNLIE